MVSSREVGFDLLPLAILVHLNWACIFLGLHSFGLSIHNDTMSALGRTSDLFTDSLPAVFAQWVQHVHFSTFGGALSSPVWSHTVYSAGLEIGLMPVQLGTSDFLVHHIHAFTIHVTALILLKGVQFASDAGLYVQIYLSDKALLGFRFPCDGPGRGGTCQVSAWDHVFLGLFWITAPFRLSFSIFRGRCNPTCRGSTQLCGLPSRDSTAISGVPRTRLTAGFVTSSGVNLLKSFSLTAPV